MMNELMAEFAGKPESRAGTIIGNYTTALPMKVQFDPKDNGYTLMFGSTCNGMSAMLDAAQEQYIEAGGTMKVIDKGPTTER